MLQRKGVERPALAGSAGRNEFTPTCSNGLLDTRNDLSNRAPSDWAHLPQRNSTARTEPRHDELRRKKLYRHRYALPQLTGPDFAEVEPAVKTARRRNTARLASTGGVLIALEIAARLPVIQ